MVNDRIEEYSRIGAYLNDPYSQRPSPDRRLKALLTIEQTLNLRITNTGKPLNLISVDIATVSGTDTYEISQPVESYQNSGKAYYVIRETDNADLPFLSIPFTDFSELMYGKMPPQGEVNSALAVPEKIAFYRTGQQNQAIKAVISPTPQEVLTYTVWFTTGFLDRSHALMDGVGLMPELTDYKCLKAAFALLPYCEWRDDDNYNAGQRQTLAVGIGAQIAELEPIVEKYLSNINAPKSFDMDYWNE
jgi:hypothetical protein